MPNPPSGACTFSARAFARTTSKPISGLTLAASRTTPGKEESYRSMRDTLAVTMTASQLAEAQRLAREWEPKTWEQLKDE